MMISGIVKLLTFWFMDDVVITTVHGDDKCKSFFSLKHMSLRAIWCGRHVILNQDGTVSGINPSDKNTWKIK
jgi:hypothetical protein